VRRYWATILALTAIFGPIGSALPLATLPRDRLVSEPVIATIENQQGDNWKEDHGLWKTGF
jgi:hypothetical protein